MKLNFIKSGEQVAYERKLKLFNKADKKAKKRQLKLEKKKQNIWKEKEANEARIKLNEQSFRKGWRNKLKDRFAGRRTVLVEMTHTNGTISNYYIKSKIHKFKWGGGEYIIDEEQKVYNNTSQTYMYRFHEGFAAPYAITVSSTSMKESLQDQPAEIKEIATSFNPSVLKDILKFEYAKGVIQGAEIHEFIKKGLIISAITLLAVLIHLGVSAYKGGWI